MSAGGRIARGREGAVGGQVTRKIGLVFLQRVGVVRLRELVTRGLANAPHGVIPRCISRVGGRREHAEGENTAYKKWSHQVNPCLMLVFSQRGLNDGSPVALRSASAAQWRAANSSMRARRLN